MKPLVLLIIFFTLFSPLVPAQDLIVTNEGDSINCRITKIEENYIHFSFKKEEDIRNTLLEQSQISTYQKNYFDKEAVPESNPLPEVNYQQVRINVSSGWAYLTGKSGENIPGDFEQYFKDLKSGVNFATDASFYFSENMGLGAKYSIQSSNNQVNQVQIRYSDGSTQSGTMSHKNLYQYIGPVLSTRLISGNGHIIFLSNYSFGYFDYNSEVNMVGREIIQTGNTIGFSGDLGLDYLPNPDGDVALGINFSYILGALSQYEERHRGNTTTVELADDERLNLSRIEIAGGIKFYF